ncbi:transposase [Clostridia bacterium]|nr:transposase [Clostridia bacterium]
MAKPRTYRNNARKDFLGLELQRKKGIAAIQKSIGEQLSYINRDLKIVDYYIEQSPERLELLSSRFKENLKIIRTIYIQQKQMYENQTHRVDDRIVSIAHPYVRPIIRGKAGQSVEFGVKLLISVVDGYVLIDYMSFDNFNEGIYLIQSVELYYKRFGHYPEAIQADTIFRNRRNRTWLKKRGIRLSGPCLGRKPKDPEKLKERRITERNDAAIRNQVEGAFGVLKRRFGLDLVKERSEESIRTTIALTVLTKNIHQMLAVISVQNSAILIFFRRPSDSELDLPVDKVIDRIA